MRVMLQSLPDEELRLQMCHLIILGSSSYTIPHLLLQQSIFEALLVYKFDDGDDNNNHHHYS
jgi:hypothetical protein